MIGEMVVYSGASKDGAIAEGLGRLKEGGCACPEGISQRAQAAAEPEAGVPRMRISPH